MPAIINGRLIIKITSSPISHEPVLSTFILKMKGESSNPVNIKIIPPVRSYFHAINSIIVNTIDGKRCIPNAASFCKMVSPSLKASSANMLTNNIATIHSVRAIQPIDVVLDIFIALIFFKVEN